MGMDSLNCISYNVKGLGNPIKRKKNIKPTKKITMLYSHAPFVRKRAFKT